MIHFSKRTVNGFAHVKDCLLHYSQNIVAKAEKQVDPRHTAALV